MSSYQTIIPTLRGISNSAISFLTAAKAERSANTSLPSEQEVLDAKFGDMLPFRMQPIILAKFQIAALESVKASAPSPVLNPAFASFDDVINLFKQLVAVIDSVDEKAFNEGTGKSLEIEVAGKNFHASSMGDTLTSFVIPNSYFHLNAMYMLLRSKGYNLGKMTYVAPFLSEQSRSDWAAFKAQ